MKHFFYFFNLAIIITLSSQHALAQDDFVYVHGEKVMLSTAQDKVIIKFKAGITDDLPMLILNYWRWITQLMRGY